MDRQKQMYTGRVKAVILDWAGTTVDYGCIGPAAVFINVFNDADIRVSLEEARRFMGLAKLDHIRSMCKIKSIVRQWQEIYHRFPTEKDIQMLYGKTVSMMVETISDHSDPIPGVLG